MAGIVNGNAVRVKKNRRVGVVVASGGSKVKVRFFDKNFTKPETLEFDITEIQPAVLRNVKA